MRTLRISIVFLVAFGLLVACAGFMPQVPETPKDKADFFMSYYMDQKADYETRIGMATEMVDGELLWKADVTNIEKDILRAKYTFISEAETPITLYDTYANQGQLPPAELEMTINSLMTRLKDYLIKQQGG